MGASAACALWPGKCDVWSCWSEGEIYQNAKEAILLDTRAKNLGVYIYICLCIYIHVHIIYQTNVCDIQNISLYCICKYLYVHDIYIYICTLYIYISCTYIYICVCVWRTYTHIHTYINAHIFCSWVRTFWLSSACTNLLPFLFHSCLGLDGRSMKIHGYFPGVIVVMESKGTEIPPPTIGGLRSP